MTPRNRVRIALNHCEPDRVPMDLGATVVSTIHQTSYRNLVNHLGLKDDQMKVMASHVNTMVVGEEIQKRFELDFVRVAMKPASSYRMEYDKDAKSFADEYGTVWTRGDNETGIHYPSAHPLAGADIDAIKAFKLPDMRDRSRVDGLPELVKDLYENTDYAIVVDGMFQTLQRCYDLYGMEDFLVDLMTDRVKARTLLDKVAENALDGIELCIRAVGDYADVFTFADDLGSQNAPMFSSAIYKRFIKPYHKLFVEKCRKYSNAKLLLHCDGAITTFLDDIADAGFDILNPLQCSARDMDPAFLKKEYGKHFSFWGGVDSQTVMSHGSPKDVEEEVRRMIDIMGEGGGYVLGNVHVIEHEIKPENIVALFDSGLRFGRYDDRE